MARKHLGYEWWMLTCTAAAVRTVPIAWQDNAVLESFTIHARVLLDFLSNKTSRRTRPTDVIASDFVNDWTPSSVVSDLADFADLVNWQVAHLTTHRVNQKSLQVADTYRVIGAELRRFVALLPDERAEWFVWAKAG